MFTRYEPQSREQKLKARSRGYAIALKGRGRAAVMVGGCSGVAVEKPEPTKPGKRTPNPQERAWMDWIVAYGCVACRMDGLAYSRPAVHHILRGGRRIGHLSTLPLCDPGHHQNGQQFGMVSRHPWKARFEAKYGTEPELLATLRAEFEKGRA